MNIEFREFRPDDAAYCFKVRASAYIRKFHDELGPDVVAACVNAFVPDDYVRMAERRPFFIVEIKNQRIGFLTIDRIDEKTAEIPLIYIDLDFLGKGIGRRCIEFIEDWVKSEWPEVDTLAVDTIIPKYNAGFYEKVGFTRLGDESLVYSGMTIKALRFAKTLNR